MMEITKEFFRYEFVGNRFACEDCHGKHDVVRCTCWLADEGDREVIWYQCARCLRGEFRFDTSNDLTSNLRKLARWLKTDKREPLNFADDFPLSPDGETLSEAIMKLFDR
jgi:hypothetical protein